MENQATSSLHIHFKSDIVTERELLRKYRIQLSKMDTARILPLCESVNKQKYYADHIIAEKVPHRRAEKFLDILGKQGSEAVEQFLDALSKIHPEIGVCLIDELNRNQVSDVT